MPKIRQWVAHIEGIGLTVEGDTEQEAIENAKTYVRIPQVFTIRVEPAYPNAPAVPFEHGGGRLGASAQAAERMGYYPAGEKQLSLRLRQILATVRKYGSYADALPAIRRHNVWVREIDELKGLGMLWEGGRLTERGAKAIGEAESF